MIHVHVHMYVLETHILHCCNTCVYIKSLILGRLQFSDTIVKQQSNKLGNTLYTCINMQPGVNDLATLVGIQEFTWISSFKNKLWAKFLHMVMLRQRYLFPYLPNNERRTNTTVYYTLVALSSPVSVTFTSNAIAKWVCTAGHLFCSQLSLFKLKMALLLFSCQGQIFYQLNIYVQPLILLTKKVYFFQQTHLNLRIIRRIAMNICIPSASAAVTTNLKTAILVRSGVTRSFRTFFYTVWLNKMFQIHVVDHRTCPFHDLFAYEGNRN